MIRTQKLTVMLVLGGDSSERDVSIETGRSVLEALRTLGHRVLVTDPLRPDVKPTEDAGVFFESASIKTEPPRVGAERFKARMRFLTVLGEFHRLGCDVVFNALHGGAGEDGTFQAVLSYLGIPYTGCGVCASAVAMDKALSKRIVAMSGVTGARQIFVDSEAHEAVVIDDQVLKTLSLPVVVKPNNEGSSVGVTIVHDRMALAKAIRAAKAYGGAYLVEEFVPGKEITAAMLDFEQLPLVEIRPKEGFYDYKNKYQAGSCDYLVPAPLDDETTRAIIGCSHAAYRALGCHGYARIDFRLHENGQPYFLEANTLPGMTANSLVPKAARAAGIEFPELVDRILRLSTPAKSV